MANKIAIALVHGIGIQGFDFANEHIAGLKAYCGEEIAADLVFKPVHWGPELETREQRMWEIVQKDSNLSFPLMRQFFMRFLGDAVAYQPGEGDRQTYDRINETLASALDMLSAKAGQRAPLVIICHSLGTVITHSFLHDLVHRHKGVRIDQPLLAQGDTLTLLYTMGSPLAVWQLRYTNHHPTIEFPGRSSRKLFPQARPRWLNIYDTEDVVGYPISNINDTYRQMADDGWLDDLEMNVGGLLDSFTPASHVGYWRDKDTIKLIGEDLKALWTAIQ